MPDTMKVKYAGVERTFPATIARVLIAQKRATEIQPTPIPLEPASASVNESEAE